MIAKVFDAIQKVDIESLIENQVREGRSIEYKRELPGKLDDDKREFLADVSSFANAGGGDLIYGVTAVDGIPREVSGLAANLDAEILRLESLVRDGVDSRILGIRMKPVEGFTAGPVLVLRIPRSWAAPHMITFKNSSRFYTRDSAGKHQLDVSELRAAFSLAGSLPEKMRSFRDDRLGKIIADETPVRLGGRGRLVLHILPATSFGTDFRLETSTLRTNGAKLRPLGGGGHERFNLDGFLTYDVSHMNGASDSYCQLYRTGQIEAVWSDLLNEFEGRQYIPSVAYEQYVIEAVEKYISVLAALEVPCPVLVLLSMIGVSGAYMGVSRQRFIRDPAPIDRDTLILPDILVEEYASPAALGEVAKLLRPTFDAVWNACGFPRSFNYDDSGNWSPQR